MDFGHIIIKMVKKRVKVHENLLLESNELRKIRFGMQTPSVPGKTALFREIGGTAETDI